MENQPNNPVWPAPKFSFKVIMNGHEFSFQEVSGLDTETQAIEYRHGNSPPFSTIKMPGVQKGGNVTLKRGIVKKDNQFWDWYQQIQMNTIKRSNVTIQLLDDGGKLTLSWTLMNAWPTKIIATDLNSEGDEIAIDTIEIAHEGMTVQ